MAKKKMKEIRFKVDVDAMTVDDLIALEEEGKLSSTKKLLAGMVLKDGTDDQYVPLEEGMAIVGAMSLGELLRSQQGLVDQIKQIQEDLVPKE